MRVGIRLITEVFDHAPTELTSGERVLLLALAESARDETRTCWPTMETLIHRTGLSDSGVRKTLARLADRGYELREAAGTDKNGKPVFACRGHATVYRLPTFAVKAGPQSHLKGGTTVPPSEEKGGTTVPERRYHSPEKAVPQSRPSPQPLREPSNHPRARADDETAAVIEALRERTGKIINENHATLVIKQLVEGRNGIRNRLAYLAGAIARDPNPDRLLSTPVPPRYIRGQT